MNNTNLIQDDYYKDKSNKESIFYSDDSLDKREKLRVVAYIKTGEKKFKESILSHLNKNNSIPPNINYNRSDYRFVFIDKPTSYYTGKSGFEDLVEDGKNKEFDAVIFLNRRNICFRNGKNDENFKKAYRIIILLNQLGIKTIEIKNEKKYGYYNEDYLYKYSKSKIEKTRIEKPSNPTKRKPLTDEQKEARRLRRRARKLVKTPTRNKIKDNNELKFIFEREE